MDEKMEGSQMEQLNPTKEDESITRNVKATVVQVEERFLRLQSDDDQIESHVSIQLSAMVAYSFLPRPMPTIPNLVDQFAEGDAMILDLRRDTGYYIPYKIHVMQFIRPGGTHIVADGLMINLTEYPGPLIRSSFLPDFVFQKNRLVSSEIEMRVGGSVTFEVLVTEGGIEGQNMRVIAEDEKGINFPIYRGTGTIFLGANDVPYIQTKWFDGQGKSIPIHEGAYYGCGIPISALVGEVVTCTVCQRDPRNPTSYFEVAYFEPCADAALPLEARALARDEVRSVGQCVNSRRGYREIQCNQLINEEIMQKLREAFLFIIEHADAANFKRMVAKYPAYVETMMQELGLDQFIDAVHEGNTADYEDVLRALATIDTDNSAFGSNRGDQQEPMAFDPPEMPTAVNFIREDTVPTSEARNTSTPATEDVVGELEYATGGLSITSSIRQPSPIDLARDSDDDSFENTESFNNQSQGESLNAGFRGRRGLNDQRPRDAQSIESGGFGARGRPVGNLSAGRAFIEPVGRSRIVDPNAGQPEDRSASGEGSPWQLVARRGGSAQRIGKVKPG